MLKTERERERERERAHTHTHTCTEKIRRIIEEVEVVRERER